MDPNQIAAMLASGDREQVISAQRQLQALGYNVKPDGKLGSETSNAVASFRTDFERKAAADQAKAEGETKVRESEANARIAEAGAKVAENDPTNQAVKMGLHVAPYVAGSAIGSGVGHFFFGNKEVDKELGKKVSNLANARNINPSVKEAQLNQLLRSRNMTDVGQFVAPGMLFGAAEFTHNVLAPSFDDKGTQDIIHSVGTGENAAASTLGVHQAIGAINSLRKGRGIDPVDVARIRSGNLPSGPDTPPAAPPPPPRQTLPPPADTSEPIRHSERAKLAAAAAGAKPGSTKEANVAAVKKNLTDENMSAVAQALKLPADATRPAVLQRLREISRTGGKLMLPLAAGALAYEAAGGGDQAQAADGSVQSSSNPLVAGGTAAGTAYGMNRLLHAVPRGGGAMFGEAAGPAMVDAMTDYTPEETAQGRNMLARNLPSFLRAGAVEDAYQMAQVPSRNPQRAAAAPGNQYYPNSGPMPNAENLPLPTEAEMSDQGQQQAPQDFESQIADLERIFAQLHSQDDQAPSPPQAAAQSQQVAQMPQSPQFYPPQQNALLQASR